MALELEIWEKDLATNFYPDNTFLTKGKDQTAFVENGKTVHSPEEGDDPNVEVNRETLPAQIKKRTDHDNTWNLNELTTDPTLLTDTESIEVNYNKRNSIIMQHSKSLNKQASQLILNQWGNTDANRIFETTGDSRLATAPGATGNRKALVAKDILKVKNVLDLEDVDPEDRFTVVSSAMYNDLLDDPNFIDASRFGSAVIPSGAIGRIFGFWVFMRSHAMIYDNAGALKALGATAAATDVESALFWHKDCVKFAKGSVKVYHNAGKADYYGDIFSTMGRAGGRKTYKGENGVVTLIQGTTT